MRVEEIVEGKEYRLLTDIGAVGYTPYGTPSFLTLQPDTVVRVNKIIKNLFHPDGPWLHTVLVCYSEEYYTDDEDYEVFYTALVAAHHLQEV